jgi:hypothetical protein
MRTRPLTGAGAEAARVTWKKTWGCGAVWAGRTAGRSRSARKSFIGGRIQDLEVVLK